MIVSIALGLLMSTGPAMSIAVENESGRAVKLAGMEVPTHYSDAPRTVLGPGSGDRIVTARGRIILPHDQAGADLVTLRYHDGEGNGCIFTTKVVRHTSAWSKLKPAATPIGSGQCDARTGRTIGDFVYVVR